MYTDNYETIKFVEKSILYYKDTKLLNKYKNYYNNSLFNLILKDQENK